MTKKLALAALLLTSSLAMTAHAVPINSDIWYTFSTNAGGTTGGCSPADPTSICTIPGTAVAVGASPWTFSGAGIFEVLDLFSLVDQFEIFNFGASVGTTSAPGGGFCGSDIAACMANPNASYGSFVFGAGNHSVTLQNISGSTAGAHVFRFTATAIPEPSVLSMMLLGLFAVVFFRRQRRTAA